MIKRQKVWRGEIITVVNYEKYQSYPNHTQIIKQHIKSNVNNENLEEKNTIPKSYPNHTQIIPQTNIDKTQVEDPPKNVRNKEIRNKDLNNIKDIAQNQKISLKDEKQEKAKELISQFCSLRGIPLDSGFFSKNIRSARSLVGNYPVELILAGITWRLKNDPDNFWNEKLFNLNIVYSHFAEWISQSKLKTKISFTDWLSKNPDFDYRKFEDLMARADSFLVAFKEARKNILVYFTEEDYKNYRLAIRQKTREAKKETKEA
jgi:hypothetical protein